MNTLRQSYIYRICTGIIAWISGQWNGSLIVGWFTNQKQPSGTSLVAGIGATLRYALCFVFEKLHLTTLLRGSVFLYPWLFIIAATVLAPLVPTMVELGLICGGFFSLVLKLGVDREHCISASPINSYVMLYAVIYFYATLTSTTISGSLLPGLLTILFVMAFFLVISCGMDDKKLRVLLWGLIAAGVLVSLYGFYQVAFPEKFRSVWTDEDMFSAISFRVYSTLENPNVLGEYFLLVLPIGAAVLLTAESWPKRILALIACGMMGVCLVLTYSRGCYLGLLFAAAVFLVLLDQRFLIVGIIAVVLSPLYLPESVLTRFTSIGDMGDSSTSYRVYIWLGTIAMLKDYWFCGVGPGMDAYNMVYPEYAYNAITAPHSHSLYLQLLCDGGICCLGIFLIMLIAFYRMMFTAICRETNRKAKIFQIAGISSITGFLVQGATDFTFYNYRVLLLFWIVMALCVQFIQIGKRESNIAENGGESL